MINPDTISGEKTLDHPEGSMLLADSIVTLVKGIAHSQHVGLLHLTVRIRAGRRVDMRIRLALDDDRYFFPGQPVIAKIPAEAVRLEAGLFRRSRQRLNRWYGRIVLIKPLMEGQTITAKIHGESWALVSTLPVLGSTSSARTWDPVNIVVDPQRIELFPSQRAVPLEPERSYTDPVDSDGTTECAPSRQGAHMTTAMRLIFITFLGFLGCSSVLLTDSLRAQEVEALEAAQNSQPAPTNMSPDEARKHFFNCPGGPSTSFRLGGKVKAPKTFNLDALRGQPTQTTVWAFYGSGASPTGFETGEWTGVSLYNLLQQAQIMLNPEMKNDLNRKVILVTGSDCYQQAFSMGELVPAIGGQHQVIVAYAKDGVLLPAEGFARIINPGDKSGARNVSNIIRIQVIDPPLPQQSPNSN